MADVQVKYTSDMQKLLRDQDKQIQRHEVTIKKLQDTVREAKKAGSTVEAAGKKGSETFGSMLTSRLTAAAAGFATVGTAARLVGDAMRFVKAETDAAIASFDQLEEQRRRLSQVATSAGDLQRLEGLADTLASREGVDRNTVRRVLFSARSEGFEGATVEEIIRNARIVSPEAQAGVAGQIPALFNGRISPIQAINATLAAAKASRLSFEDIARGLPGAAEGAALSGSSAAETFALESVLASRFKSGETAADRIKAFGTAVSLDKDLAGKGILNAVRTLQAATPERRAGFLGSSQELNVAFSVISDELATISERQSSIEAAISTADTSSSVMSLARSAALSPDTEVGRLNFAARQRDIARIERELENERALAESGFGAQAAIDRSQARLTRRGATGVERFGASTAGQAVQLMTQRENAVTFASEVGAQTVLGGMTQLLSAMRLFFSDQREAAKELKDAAKQISTATGQSRMRNAAAARQVPSMATE